MNRDSLIQLKQAASYLDAGRLNEAETICRRVSAVYPTATDALHLLALVLRRQGRFAEAIPLFEASLNLAPERADIRTNFGNLLKSTGQVPAAIDQYRLALETDPSFRTARISLSRALNATGDFAGGEEQALKLIATNENDAAAWVTLAESHRGLDQPNRAEGAYREALKINPDYGVAHHNLGAMLAKQSRSEESLKELRLAERAGITGPELAYNLSTALAALYRFDDAESVLLDALKIVPGDIDAHRQLARIRFMRGDEDFSAGIRDAFESASSNLLLRLAYSQIVRAAGQLEMASDILTEAPDGDLDNPMLMAELAAIHQESGNYRQALRCAEASGNESINSENRTNLMIDALMSLGRADEAMVLIETGRQKSPLNQWYVAMEATAARLLDDPRYRRLYDYERFVKPYELDTPSGWANTSEFIKDLCVVLNERHQFDTHPLDQSLRHGTQTPRGLLGDPHPTIHSFLDALAGPLAEYREHLGLDEMHPMTRYNRGALTMTGCWSVRLKKGGFHVNHVHPEGWISSAFYAELPDEVQDQEARSGWIKFGEPRFPVPGAIAEKFVQPQVGVLVLFPSYMWHGTTPIHGDQPRMTIAFDAVCKVKGAPISG